MRPETIDDVLQAFEMAVRELRVREARMRAVAAKLDEERGLVDEQQILVRSMRAETLAALDVATQVAA